MAIRDLWRRGRAKASIVGLPASEQPDKPLERTFDDTTLLSTFRDDAWPYILANKIGEQASQAPLQVGTTGPDGTFTPVSARHPVQALLDKPNPQTDGGEFVHLLVVYMEMVGHSPIEVVKTRAGQPGELWLHNPGPWRIVAAADRTITGYLYLQERGADVAWTPDQMCYTRWPDPNNPWYGQGRITAVRNEVMAEEYASTRDKQFEKRLGVPPGVLSSEMPLGEPQAEELRKRWEKAVGGYQNAGRIAVLGSKTTYVPISLSARYAQWLEQRGRRVETLAAAFGVPMPLIRMEGATFSNAEQARAEFWEGTLQPRLNRIARMLTIRLLPLLTREPLVVRFDYSAIDALGENDLQAAQTATAWSATGAVTVDEVRTRLGLKPHPSAEIGGRLLKPSTLSLASETDITAPPAPPPPAPSAPPPPPAKMKAQRRDREIVLAPVRDAWKRDLNSYFRAQQAALVPIVGKSGKSDHVRGSLKDALQNDPELLARIRAILTELRFRDRLRRISEAPITASLTLGATDAADLLGIDTTFDLAANESAINLLTQHLAAIGTGIENTTLADVQGVLESALRNGLTNDEIRAALGDLFDGYENWRLDRIARTETTAAYNLGSVAQYREGHVQLVRVVDGDGDNICAEANGSLWTLDDAEGDPLGHPNCTRTFIPDTDTLRARKPTERDLLPLLTAMAVKSEPVSIHVVNGQVLQMRTVIDRDPATGKVTGSHEEPIDAA